MLSTVRGWRASLKRYCTVIIFTITIIFSFVFFCNASETVPSTIRTDIISIHVTIILRGLFTGIFFFFFLSYFLNNNGKTEFFFSSNKATHDYVTVHLCVFQSYLRWTFSCFFFFSFCIDTVVWRALVSDLVRFRFTRITQWYAVTVFVVAEKIKTPETVFFTEILNDNVYK